MKRFHKKLFLSVLGLTLLLGLTACHGSKGLPEFVVPDDFNTSSHYEITFWAKNDTNKTQTDIYKKAIKDFEALYPNITVNLRLYTDYGKIYNDVITNISTGTTPNICITYPDHIATYMTGENIVVPLDDLFSDAKYGLGGSGLLFDSPTYEQIIPRFLEECDFSGSHYAIPFMRSTEACYVNKTYVEALGYQIPDVMTWDFIWEVSEAAMKKDVDGNYQINGQKVMIPFIYKSSDNMMITYLKQADAGYSDSDGNIELFNDTTADFLYKISEHVATGAFSTFKISGYPGNFLNAGQCIFAIDSTAGATWMGSSAPLCDISEEKLVDFETEVCLIPQVDPEKPAMISQGPSICVFNKKDSQEVLASWLFAQYLLTNEVQIAYAETEGYVPVTEKAQSSDEYKDYLSRSGENDTDYYEIKIKASRLLLDHIEDTFITPVFNGSASLRDAASQLIENVTRSIKRKVTVDESFIQQLYKDVTALYHLGEHGSSAPQKKSFGPLPTAARMLIIGLFVVWGFILCYIFLNILKKTSKKKKIEL